MLTDIWGRKKQQPFLIVGLGNPGTQYEHSWHNCGFDMLDSLAQDMGEKIKRLGFKGAYESVLYQGHKLILLKPGTYMNLSGESVRAAMDFYKIPLSRLLVVYDDIDLELGRVRLLQSGGCGTHKGMLSIKQHLGSDAFMRLRIGFGPVPEHRTRVDFVLQKQSPQQQAEMQAVYKQCVAGIQLMLREGPEAAMQFLNTKAK